MLKIFKIILISILSSTSFITSVSYAHLNIDITQGLLGEIPITITEFEGSKGASISSVIKNDLGISGRFKVIEAKKNATLSELQSLGVENMVVGQITPVGANRYTISFELVDIFNMGAPKRTLIHQSYENIRSEDSRALAHRMSDAIYQALTGVKGFFSSRIAYVLVNHSVAKYPYALEIADADGYNPKTLMRSKEPIMSPAWSPDGKQLAFVSFEKKESEVYIIDIATGKRELVTRFPGINGEPAWSKDGHSLALVLSKEGSPKIYLIDLASKQLKQITQGTNIDTEPVFEPSGESLLFTSNRGGQPQIYRVSLKDKSVERVTFNGTYNACPRLTQDGKKMVMIHQSQEGHFHIATQNLQTGEVLTLTQSQLDNSPSLAPNGTMVLYGTSDNQQRKILGMVTIDGRGRLLLPARQGDVLAPAWSPYI